MAMAVLGAIFDVDGVLVASPHERAGEHVQVVLRSTDHVSTESVRQMERFHRGALRLAQVARERTITAAPSCARL